MTGIYVRISDDEQSQYSISDQLRECRIKAATNEIVEYIDEGITGSIMERPALTRLRNDVKSGLITRIVIWDPDRFSRDLMIQLMIANELEKRAELIFVNHNYQKTPEGILFFQMRGAFSQFEKAKIADRTTRGRREKARQGKIVKNSFLYGYNYNPSTSSYEINEDEASIVRLIFDLFTKPNTPVKGMNGIAKYLTNMGVPTKRGAAVWHRQVVRQILMNRSYTGRHAQNKWNTEGMVGNRYRDKEDRVPMKERPETEWITTDIPKIIEEYQFEHAQMMIEQSKRRHAPEALRKYLLSGLVRCGECGNTMTGRRTKNWGAHVFEYTDVKNYAGAKFKGCGMKVRCEKLDELVWSTVHNWLNNPDEVAAAGEAEEKDSFEQSELERLSREIERIRNQRKNLIKLFSTLDDDADQEEVRVQMRELSDKEKTTQDRISQLSEKIGDEKNKEYSRKLFADTVNYYLTKGVDEITDNERRELIRAVVKEIRVYKDKVDIFSF